jgi:sucrose-phosphate synthase
MKLAQTEGIYIVLISAHGLIRGHDLELGGDADTGGQTKYVVELARALAAHPDVAHVDLLTRRVVDPKVHPDYAEAIEPLAPGANLVRLSFGPRRYLRKEVLWPHLDSMADQALKHIRGMGRVPDIIHSHYADAGYVGARLAGLLGTPLVHTGHSLGREKRRRLLDQGMTPNAAEQQYALAQRIEAEEMAMDTASLVIASTAQEVEQQYALYENYHPKRMVVIPPGTDLSRFHPPRGLLVDNPVKGLVNRFLSDPRKPLILALSRADERKNIHTLVRAYGENPHLRERANLLIVAGNRDDIEAADKGTRKVLTDLLLRIDRYDLYGSVAYPKQHQPDQVADFYRLAAKSGGLFVNPALTEPFGLTLIEAAASGLPVVATSDGGPRDIIRHCRNGVLIDPLDAEAMGEALLDALSDRRRWKQWAANGSKGAQRHYGWKGHVNRYVKELQRLLGKQHHARPIGKAKSRLPTVDRLLVCDIDNTLTGDRAALAELMARLRDSGGRIGFGVATGRNLEGTRKVLKEWGIPHPDLVITCVGSEIYYGRQQVEDRSWSRHIDYRWEPERLRNAMESVPGVRLQAASEQRRHKISYIVDPDTAPPVRKILRYLRNLDLHANLIFSHDAFLDLLPIRASKGQAVRYVGARWGIAAEHMVVAGDSGNDIEMLRGDILGVVVGNFSRELAPLRTEPRIYFAEAHYAAGVLEGLRYYGLIDGSVRAREEA